MTVGDNIRKVRKKKGAYSKRISKIIKCEWVYGKPIRI